MSRYKTLATEANNSYISPFAVSTLLVNSEKNIDISPASPRDEKIPSNLNQNQKMGAKYPAYPTVHSDSTYGPSSTGYASLRSYAP